MSEHLEWKVEERKKALSCGIFDVYLNTSRDAEGTKATFVSLALNDWVIIIPMRAALEKTKSRENEFLMVRQFRHGSELVVTEFPAGIVEPGEDPQDTAARELKEETGYAAERIIHLGSINPNPSFLTNRVHCYLAQDLYDTGIRNLDPHERIETVFLPRRIVEEQIGKIQSAGDTRDTGADIFDNGTMMMALGFLWRSERTP